MKSFLFFNKPLLMVLNPSVRAQLCSVKSSRLHLTKADLLVPSILQIPFQILYALRLRSSRGAVSDHRWTFAKPYCTITLPSYSDVGSKKEKVSVKRAQKDIHGQERCHVHV